MHHMHVLLVRRESIYDLVHIISHKSTIFYISAKPYYPYRTILTITTISTPIHTCIHPILFLNPIPTHIYSSRIEINTRGKKMSLQRKTQLKFIISYLDTRYAPAQDTNDDTTHLGIILFYRIAAPPLTDYVF